MLIDDGILEKVNNEDIKNGTFEIPEEVTALGMYAFKNCSSLISIVIPDSVDKIGKGTFQGCNNLTRIEIPDSLDYIGSAAFKNCSSLTNIVIPEGVEEIDAWTFKGCGSLTNIVIPDSVDKIRMGAFENCSSLTNISIPDSVTGIGSSAFKNCSSLTSIEIPKNMEKIGHNIFEGCNSIGKTVVREGNKIFKTEDGVLYAEIDEEKVLILYPPAKKDSSYTVSKETSAIFAGAFEGGESLKEVRVPANLLYQEGEFFNYNNIIYDKANEEIVLRREKTLKSSKYIPLPYLIHLNEIGETGQFIETADFRAFNSNIPNLKEILKKYPEEEKLDFFKFAVCLGCFNNEKVLDESLKETEATVGQKASALLAKLMKTPELQLGKYHGLFDSLSFEAMASQEFLKFITPQGKKNDNLELLLKLEKKYPGMFSKVLSGFNAAKEYRHTLAEDGTTKTISWEEAFKKFYEANRYLGITEETKDIAELYGSKGIEEQGVFDRGVQLREKARSEGIPNHILGREIREVSIFEKLEQLKQKTAEELGESQEIIDDLYSKQFTFEWLDKDNPINGILGIYVSCCGTITSQYYGKKIAENSIIKRDVQNLVVRDAKGEIVSKGTVYVNEEHGYGVFNDFELNQKYREHEDRENGYGGKYAGDDKEEDELTDAQRKQRKERDLIFAAFQRGIKAFVEEYDKQHLGKPIRQINVGMGYNRLKRNVEQFEKATELLTVPAEYSFQDAAKRQFVLYSREEKEKEVEKEL